MSHEFTLSVDITDFNFSKEALAAISDHQWVKNQWPLIYLLQNSVEKIAYVGESANAYTRINNHLDNPQRSTFTKISIIGSDKFNKSATLTIESQLIQHISAEGSFILQNGNNGLSYHNFYQRSEYDKQFEEIWARLLKKKVVKKTIEEIQNSDFFKYSPYKSLNQDQYNSVLEVIESLNKKYTDPVFVQGSSGTGKTILAIYLIKLLTARDEELNTEGIDDEGYRELELIYEFKKKYPNPTIGLVVSMKSLRRTLQRVFKKTPGLHASMVIRPIDTFSKKYDILIVDEAHRLRQRTNISWMKVFTDYNNRLGLGNDGTELDWIMANSEHQIFFYDPAQSIKPSDVPQERFDKLLIKPSTITLQLKSQMRIKAGSDYLTFVDNLLNYRLNEVSTKFEPLNYELRVFESFKELYSELSRKEKQYKLCRLIAGFAWPWVTQDKDSEQTYDIEIEGIKLCWNRISEDWINSTTSFEEIGCIHTTQGYDLNYTGIIFGKEIIYNPEHHRIEIIKENYYDRNGKAGITDPEVLKAYIINIYKTLMYRGIRGTYIYACDENLRKYLRESIHSGTYVDTRLKTLPIDKVRPYVNSVPIFDIHVAAGNFSEPQVASDRQWVELPKQYKPSSDYFVCKVQGESMNTVISNGSWCLFRKDTGGSREGKIVLVSHYDIQDGDFGMGYTVKQYHSEKSATGEDEWGHIAITLKPLSDDPSYEDIVLTMENSGKLKVEGLFVAILS